MRDNSIPIENELDFPDEMKEFMDRLDNLIVTDNDREECLAINLMFFLDPDDPEDPTLTEKDFFDLSLIHEALEFVKKAKSVREVSDFVWERIDKIECE